jgi:hypothetical protein
MRGEAVKMVCEGCGNAWMLRRERDGAAAADFREAAPGRE